MIPRMFVPPPAWTPARFGLLSVVQQRYGEQDPHWRNGITYQVQCGGTADTYDPCVAILAGGSAAPAPPDKSATDELTTRAATPFTVYAYMRCNAVGWYEQASAHAQTALDRAERWQVERAFWTGHAGGQEVVYPHLAADTAVTDDGAILQTAATVVAAGAVDAVKGLALLEQALADCYEGQGVIHVPDALMPILASARQIVEDDDGRYRTWNGHLVAVGAGYPGTGPDGLPPAADTVWMYATGQIVAYRGEAEVTRPEQGLDRATNIVTVLAERQYLLAWDCCHFAVQVQVENAGGAGGGVQASDISATAPLTWDVDTETMAMAGGSDGQYLATAGTTPTWETAGEPGTLAGPLDGSGKIPAGQLPPAQLHETFEAADQAAMLAAPVTAPSIAVRTDFVPAHLFYLHTDPATDLGNWEDLGAGISAAADPTGLVGTAPVNGVGATYMRSDGAPAINQGMSPTWTGHHTFAGAVTVTSGAGAARVLTSDAGGNATWQAPAVQSVAGKTGAVALVKADVGLSNVDNTSDAAKPVSTAQQTALDTKATTAALSAHEADIDVGGHVPTGGTPGQILTRGAGSTAAWAAPPSAPVTSVNTKTGVVTLTAADLAALPIAGGTLTGLLTILENVATIKARLAMKLPGTQSDAPTTLGIASTYLGIGGGEWNANSYRLIGLGYIAAAGNEYPSFIGYQETSTTSNTRGDLVLGTRPNNNNVAPSVVMRINSGGQILAEAGAAYVAGSPGALTTKKNVDDAVAVVNSALTTHEAATGAGTHLPAGGTAGQIPVRGAANTVTWQDAPSGGAAVWGGITGTMSTQTDLQQELDGRVLLTSKATEPQVLAGTDDTKWMTPLGVKQAIDNDKAASGIEQFFSTYLTIDTQITGSESLALFGPTPSETGNQVWHIDWYLYISAPSATTLTFVLSGQTGVTLLTAGHGPASATPSTTVQAAAADELTFGMDTSIRLVHLVTTAISAPHAGPTQLRLNMTADGAVVGTLHAGSHTSANSIPNAM